MGRDAFACWDPRNPQSGCLPLLGSANPQGGRLPLRGCIKELDLRSQLQPEHGEGSSASRPAELDIVENFAYITEIKNNKHERIKTPKAVKSSGDANGEPKTGVT